jgi:phytoene dehydrogenase-like protein
MASTLSCGRSEQLQNEVTRRGEDVLATGSMATVMDSVPGDAILAGGDLSFAGATGGDYLGAGGKQAVTGRIHGSLRAAGGEVHVAAAVDRNTTIAGGTVELDSAAVIARNAYLIGGAGRHWSVWGGRSWSQLPFASRQSLSSAYHSRSLRPPST